MFNKRLREIRMKCNFTQQKLADSADIALRTYQNYEQGIREPSFYTLFKLAETLDVSLDYLFGRCDDPKNHHK